MTVSLLHSLSFLSVCQLSVSVYMTVCLSFYFSTWVTVFLFEVFLQPSLLTVCLFVSLYECIFVCLSESLSDCGFIWMNFCLSVWKSIRLWVCLTVCLSFYPTFCLSVLSTVCQSDCLSLFDCLFVFVLVFSLSVFEPPCDCLSFRLSDISFLFFSEVGIYQSKQESKKTRTRPRKW